MPHDEADETDPLMLVGVELPGEASSAREAARVYAEEFARLGYGERELLALFRNPFYAGAHQAFLELGEEAVRALVAESLSVWGAVRFREIDSRETDIDPGTGMVLLPVLEPGGVEGRRSDHA